MGTAQSLLTPQNVVAVVLLLAAVATAWYNHTRASALNESVTSERVKKGKKKKATSAPQDTSSTISDKGKDPLLKKNAQPLAERSVPEGIPETPEATDAPKSTKEKKRKAKKSMAPAITTASESATASAPVAGPSRQSTGSGSSATDFPGVKRPVANDPKNESWTRVESRRRTSGQNLATSDAGLTTATSADGSSSGTTERTGDEENSRPQKTLAEKLLPKGRKTAVDDMLESSQYPELSRVMRVTPGANEKPATGFSWGDYEDVEDVRGADADGEDDGGWGVVKSRGKAKHSQSYPSAAATPQPRAPETLTKKQRQNASKREATKSAKADAEAERQAQLSKHKRELEQARIAEQYSRKGGGLPVSSNVSGGMKATVDEKGQLVWD